MEPSFQRRLDQVFGSLGSSSARRPWSLSDQKLERKEWISGRERSSARDETPCASSYEELSRSNRRARKESCLLQKGKGRGLLEDDDADYNDDDELEDVPDGGDRMEVEEGDGFRDIEAGEVGNCEDAEEEGRQMRRMVGLDSTLDLEDEEDEFDKVGQGDGEIIYMREVQDSDTKVGTFNYNLKSAPRDPRANHLAARARLEEDARDAEASSVYPEMKGEQEEMKGERDEMKGEHEKLSDAKGKISSVGSVEKIYSPGFTCDLSEKLLKRNIGDMMQSSGSLTQHVDSEPTEGTAKTKGEGKPFKRVRFALEAVEPDVQNSVSQQMHIDKASVIAKRSSAHASVVPDHVRNPSKYTHYTLDWSDDEDEESNLKAFKECEQFVRRPLQSEHEDPKEPPQKIKFIPRSKESDGANQNSSSHSLEEKGVDSTETTQSLARRVGVVTCDDDLEEQSEILGTFGSSFETMKDVSDFKTVTEVKSNKVVKRYRSKKLAEAEEEMET